MPHRWSRWALLIALVSLAPGACESPVETPPAARVETVTVPMQNAIGAEGDCNPVVHIGCTGVSLEFSAIYPTASVWASSWFLQSGYTGWVKVSGTAEIFWGKVRIIPDRTGDLYCSMVANQCSDLEVLQSTCAVETNRLTSETLHDFLYNGQPYIRNREDSKMCYPTRQTTRVLVSAAMKVGDTQTASAQPLNPAGEVILDGCSSVSWTSNNTVVASIGSDGTITAKAPGSALIIGNCDGISGEAGISVSCQTGSDSRVMPLGAPSRKSTLLLANVEDPCNTQNPFPCDDPTTPQIEGCVPGGGSTPPIEVGDPGGYEQIDGGETYWCSWTDWYLVYPDGTREWTGRTYHACVKMHQ